MTRLDNRSRGLVVLATLSLMLAAGPALAFGGGDDSSSQDQTPQCKKGEVYSKAKGHCVKAQSSGLPDDELLRQGRQLALAGQYDDALTVLAAVKNQQNAMVLTYIGYSHRKKGETDIGIGYYKQALAIEPDSLNTHEYLGEGYASAGRIELAKAELVTVQRLCGNTSCEQYADLSAAIAGKPVE